jgi:hypothetical protein
MQGDELQANLRRVVLRVFHHKYGCHFIEPVDVKSHPDYLNIVQRPICLHEILAKANSRSYSKPEDLVEDMSLMFSNALNYNSGDSGIWFRKQTNDLDAYFKCVFHATFGSEQPVAETVQSPVSSAAEAPTNKKRGRSDKKRRVTRQEIIDGGVDIATLLSTASKMCKNECETIRSLTAELDLANKRCQNAVAKSEELQTMNEKLTKELFQWRLLGDNPPAYVVLE